MLKEIIINLQTWKSNFYRNCRPPSKGSLNLRGLSNNPS